ncbi:uncharacterized protein LOC129250245 [Anastrepha obliqua]|uniref:uncharacterized protein LOC129250245 n=1 Tax=Anastrepha obliqua TaxID=95512 RepID=UPI002409DC50|nr:uncharacterized protein LOC129250245 [Anastrepha obliqua]
MIKLNTLKVIQLNTLLRANGLPTTGLKTTKVSRLQQALGVDEIDPSELEDEGVESTNDLRMQLNSLREAMAGLTSAIGTLNGSSPQVLNHNANQQTSNVNDDVDPVSNESTWESADDLRRVSYPRVTIQDMIGVMPEFDPLKSLTSPTQFLIRAEQLQKCHGWKEEMMLIAVQHQMKGMAKRWLDAQPVFQSWSQFVNAFKIDFPSTHNAAEAHKMLMRRKRKNGEDYVEYYYSMLTIGRQGLVDDVSINTHIISGLNDGALTKALAAMSFGSCSQLLLALKNLTITSSISTTSTTPTQQILKSETKCNAKQTQVKCFNCNEYGHIAIKCPQPQKKVRCTVCTKIGHEAKNCNKKPTVVEIGNHNESDEAPPVMKVVELNGKEFEAFIDTGSVCSLIRESAADGMQILGTNKCLTGFGGSKVQVTRQVSVVANVDNVQREIALYIVADSLLPYDILLGRDVLQNNGYHMVVDKGVLHLDEIKINNFNISSDLSEEDKSKVRNLLVDKQNCFAEDISRIGRCKSAQMTIEVTKSGPILGKKYQVPFSQRPELSRILVELLDNEIISPSSSPHAASVLLVKKSNGENRMCIDYRALNEVTVKKN